MFQYDVHGYNVWTVNCTERATPLAPFVDVKDKRKASYSKCLL